MISTAASVAVEPTTPTIAKSTTNKTNNDDSTTSFNNSSVVVPRTVSEWAERNHGAIRTISSTDDGDYNVQIGKLHRMGSQLVESTLEDVRGMLNVAFSSPSPTVLPPLSTSTSTSAAPESTNNISQLEQDLCRLIEKRDTHWRPDAEELHAVRKLLSDSHLLLQTSSPTSTKNSPKGKNNNNNTANTTSASSSAVLTSVEALISEVLSLRKQSQDYSVVVSNLVGGGGGGGGGPLTLLPPIVSPTQNSKRSVVDGGQWGSRRQYISSSHDQLTQALKKASSSQQHQSLYKDGVGNVVFVDDSKRAIRKTYEDMYVRGEERQYPRPCYVALGESEDRRTALRGATVVKDNAFASNMNSRSNASGGGGIFANEPGSVTWASTANAHKYGYDSNTQQLHQPRHGGGHQPSSTSPSPDLYVGVKMAQGGLGAQGGPIPVNGKHKSRVAAVVTQRNPFFRHHHNNVHQSSEGDATNTTNSKSSGTKSGRGRILSEIERKLEDGYRTHKFVTVDVAAEKEGLEYIEDDDEDNDSSDADPERMKKAGTDNDDEEDEEFDPEVSMLHDEMQSEEKRDQKYREKKRRKPGAGAGGLSGVALGTGSGLVVTEAEVTRRAEQAQLLRNEEAARIRAGGKQKRSQVQMMVSNNFAKMAAKGEKVDPFAMVRYGDIETIQDRRRASTGAIQAVLHTVAQEVQQYKINQSGGGTAATLPGGEEDRRVVPTLRPSQTNCVTSLQSSTTTPTTDGPSSLPHSKVEMTSKKGDGKRRTATSSSSNPNKISEATMRQLASKSKVHRGPPKDDDDDE